MYEVSPERGAWYTCKMTIDKEGNVTFSFDYDDKPSWDHQPMEEEYANDLKNFKRKTEAIPIWLKPIAEKFKAKYQLAL